jgi:radical SAM superfamily enzyme YgiQ (UPF0313 family)
MKEILYELRRRGVFTVVGGPWVTVREDDFVDLADVIFVGEPEETWPRFLAEWGAGRHQIRYEQAERRASSVRVGIRASCGLIVSFSRWQRDER